MVWAFSYPNHTKSELSKMFSYAEYMKHRPRIEKLMADISSRSWDLGEVFFFATLEGIPEHITTFHVLKILRWETLYGPKDRSRDTGSDSETA